MPAGTTVWTPLGLRGCLESAFFIFASIYYTPGQASTTDESQRHQIVPSGPWTSLQRRQMSPWGRQMCQLDSQGVPAWVYVGVSILHLHTYQQPQRTGLEPLDEHSAASVVSFFPF